MGAEGKVRRFGPYIILDRIGDGGMAEIFLAKVQGYSGFEKLLALKRIHPKYSENHTFAQMLIHEAKLAACLQHFNVVQVHDLGEIDGQVFIGMEYVRGRDLAAVLSNTYRRKERLPLNLALCIATEFMTGLDYAHRMRSSDGSPLGIIHRDISPQNILISYEGEVKVTDFGIARVISGEKGFRLPGNLHGKFGYMSPEQVLGHEIDQRSDIFSTGVVLWEMLTGTRLFRNKDHKKTIKMIVSYDIPPPSSVNEEVPPSVDRICAKALARDRTTRYQTMGALLGELSRVADTLPRRAATRDLAVYMRRQFGTTGGGYVSSRSSRGSDRSSVSQHSGFDSRTAGVSQVSGFSMTAGERLAIGQILMEQGAITVGDLEIALAEQRARGGRIGELLVASGTVSEEALQRAISVQSGLPTIAEADLLALSPPAKLLKRFPKDAAESTLILPISVNEAERSVGLAVVDPYDERALLETKVVLGVNDVALFVAKRTSVRAAIEAWYPEDEEEEPITEQEPIFEPQPAEVPAGPPVVLFADADEDMLAEVVKRVQEEDCEVLVATDGKKARDLLRTKRPSVAFLDAALPGIDGYNLLLELRSKNDEAAVFITSNRGDDFRQAKALELGADDFVVKPFSLEITASKIRREVQKRSGGRKVLVNPIKFDGVSGSLKDMTALDIAQSLELGRKSAHVILQYEDERSGELNVSSGQIKGAVSGKLLGEEAFYTLMRPGDGLFRIEYRASTCPKNIAKPNTYLMIEAMRRLDPEDQAAPTPQPPTQAPRIPSGAPVGEPPMRNVAPGSDPNERPLTPPPSFAELADDLTLEPSASPRAANPATPVGSELAGALDALIEQHMEDRPTEVVRVTKPSGTSDYSMTEAKKLARVPLRRISSPKPDSSND